MRKEVLWAAIIGIVFGLVVAFGAWRINSSFKKKDAVQQASPTPKANFEFKILLNKPEDKDVVTEDTVMVSGLTKPLLWITLSGEKYDYIIQADDKGGFEQEVNLVSGVNQIKVTAFDPEGNESIEKVLIVYSSAFQKKTLGVMPTSDDDSSGSAIREKVQEKVEAALNKPKAYIGIVTDISDSTIQIKTQESEIKQISTGLEDVAVVNATGATPKTIKLTDIGIGDFIVAMGYINGNSVLSAQRILVTTVVKEPQIASNFGKVTATTKKSISVSSLSGNKNVELTPSTKTELYAYSKGETEDITLSEISSGDLVIYVNDAATTTPFTRSVFVVQTAVPEN